MLKPEVQAPLSAIPRPTTTIVSHPISRRLLFASVDIAVSSAPFTSRVSPRLVDRPTARPTDGTTNLRIAQLDIEALEEHKQAV